MIIIITVMILVTVMVDVLRLHRVVLKVVSIYLLENVFWHLYIQGYGRS